MTASRPPFAASHPWDRNFFAAFIVICWIAVGFGFFPASSARIMGHADYPAPWVLHVHAAAFMGWLALLSAQILLLRARRVAVHRRLGLVAVALIPVMAITAIASEFYSQRFHLALDDKNLAFFIQPILNVVAFVVLSTCALVAARRDPTAHKRWILLGTTVIVGIGFARWWGEALEAAVGDGFWGMIINAYTGANLILLLAVGYDLVTRRRIHPAYLAGLPFVLGVELLASWIYHAPWWMPVSRGLVESSLLRIG